MKRKIFEELIKWKKLPCKKRIPLILNGARQVGKTHTLRAFGKEFYKNTVYVNFETNAAVASYFDGEISPARIIRYIEAMAGEKIIPAETLIIFDEIQSCERALTSLKYFCEDAPEYHIAGAGSLLGVAINREKYSFPVGKVRTLTLFPFDFEEFLWAQGEELLCNEIKNSRRNMSPLTEGLHQKALELYRSYLIVGGMPACVKLFCEQDSFIDVSNTQSEILDNYIADMAKYSSNSESVKIRACYNSIPSQLAKDNRKFQYKTVQKGGTATIFGASIEWLRLAGVVIKCQKIEHGFDPIAVYADQSAFKLYMGDVGLLVMKSGLFPQTILSGAENTFMGALTENYVAQQLASRGIALYYWESANSAEVDFVIQDTGIHGSAIRAIEVKKGINTKSKSIGIFAKKYPPCETVRISSKNFGESESGIKSVPLYAVFCL